MTTNSDILLDATMAKFSYLSEAEKRILFAAQTGDIAVCIDEGEEVDTDKPDTFPQKLNVRAEFIRWLCTNTATLSYITSKGIQIGAVRIIGNLDLQRTEVRFPLVFANCLLPEETLLMNGVFAELGFIGCRAGQIIGSFSEIHGSLSMINNFHSTGGVHFEAATIHGQVICSDSRFDSPDFDLEHPIQKDDDVALSFAGAKICGRVTMSGKFSAMGQVRLVDTEIGRDLDLSGGQFINIVGGRFSLCCSGMKVNGDVQLENKFLSIGECRLIAATIGGSLNIIDGTCVQGATGYTITVDRSEIRGNCNIKGCYISGEIHAVGIHVNEDLNFEETTFVCDGATVNNVIYQTMDAENESEYVELFKKESKWNSGVTAEYITVSQRFRWKDMKITEGVILDLFHSNVGSIIDDEESWPETGNLIIDGFTYDSIAIGPRDAESRLRWLERQDSDKYFPQPYEQLIHIFRKDGQNMEATRIAMAKQERRRLYGKLNWWQSMGMFILKIGIGYGYRPQWALGWITTFVILGWIIFEWGDHQSLLVRTDEVKGITFNSFMYSLDTFLPIVDLHQAKHWLPAFNHDEFLTNGGSIVLGKILRIYHWLHMLIGWLLSTLAVVGFTGLIRKD